MRVSELWVGCGVAALLLALGFALGWAVTDSTTIEHIDLHVPEGFLEEMYCGEVEL